MPGFIERWGDARTQRSFPRQSSQGNPHAAVPPNAWAPTFYRHLSYLVPGEKQVLPPSFCVKASTRYISVPWSISGGSFGPQLRSHGKKKKNTPVRQFSLSKNMTRVGGAHAYFSASNLVLWRVSSGGGGLVAARLRHVRCYSPRENLHHHGSYIMNSAVDV